MRAAFLKVIFRTCRTGFQLLTGAKSQKCFPKKDFFVVHQRGSHIYLTDQERKRKVTVPRHDPIRRGTLLAILEQAGLTREEFLELFG